MKKRTAVAAVLFIAGFHDMDVTVPAAKGPQVTMRAANPTLGVVQRVCFLFSFMYTVFRI